MASYPIQLAASEIERRLKSIPGLETKISNLDKKTNTKAEQAALNSAIADIAKNTGAITDLNNTIIPAIDDKINSKANASDVYTKEDIGIISENKTLIQMIEEIQVSASYDDTAIRALIQGNTDSIAAINDKDTGILATAKKYTEDQIAALSLATLIRGEGEAITITKGFILPEVNKFELIDGKVTKISVDLLENGESELILNGGAAI